jgi:zinc protease
VCGTVGAESTPLPSDQSLLRGTLDNGLEYIIRQHANPPGKMALILNVDTGSLNETDAQRGIAHFVEHLAFNGSENFPPGEVVKYFESIGMQFGGDINAFTSFDQTAYMLFTPDTEEVTIDRAMLCLSDQAFRLLLLADEIEKERGVILAEVRSGQGPNQRIRDKLFPMLFPGSRFAVRMPIGKEELIAKFPRQEFVDYYRKWYRPEHMTLIAVGDADPQSVVPLIKKNFGTYKIAIPLPRQEKGEIKAFAESRAMVVSDPEIATAEVEMMNVAPGRPPVTTEAAFRQQLIERIGTWIVGRRFQEMVQKGDASFRSGRARVSNFFNEVTMVAGSVEGEPANWNKMLDELVMTMSRAREHGFTQRELEQAKTQFISRAERSVERESTTPARRFLMRYNMAVNNGSTIMSAKQTLDLYNKLLPAITLKEVNATFAKHYAPGNFAYVVTMPETEEVKLPDKTAVLAAARAALSRKTEAIVEKDRPDSILAARPEPGKIVDETRDDELGITSAWLSNGVRVHHRYMDYRKDTVLVSIRLAGGSIEEGAANRGVTEVAALVFNQPATSRLTSTDIRDLTTGKKVSLGGGDLPDQLAMRISGSPTDIETGFELAHALLTDGRIEESAFKNWQKAMLEQIEAGEKSPQYQLAKAVRGVQSGHDPRLRMMTKEQVQGQDRKKAQAWFDRIRREAPIEVAVVGEIDQKRAMELAARYVGSLPTRPRNMEQLDALRDVRRDLGPHRHSIAFDSMTPKAVVFAGFFSCEQAAVPDVRALRLASKILTTRMIKDIREEKQLVYSIGAVSQPSGAYRDSGLFFGAAPTDPQKAERLADEVLATFAGFAENGPTADELDVAKKQIANEMDTRRKEPRFWLDVLADLDFRGRSLKDVKNDLAAYQAATIEDVTSAFKKYHQPDRVIRVTVTPVQAEEPVRQLSAKPASS